MALSFSPASTQPPSWRSVSLLALKLSLSDAFSAFSCGTCSAPGDIASSRKASRVPEVGGGP